MEYTVESASVFKQGTGTKGPWTIYKLKLVGDPQEPTGFTFVNPGDRVTLVSKQTQGKDGKTYTNLNYEKVEAPQGAAAAQQTTAAAPTTSGISDPRVLKLLVVIADQIGVDKNTQLDILGG